MVKQLTNTLAVFMATLLMAATVPLAPAYADIAAGEAALLAQPAAQAAAQTLVKIGDDGSRTPLATGSNGTFAISEPGTYELEGAGTAPVAIAGGARVTLVLSDATIDAAGAGSSAIAVTDGAHATLHVSGACSLTGDVNCAGIEVAPDAALVIEGDTVPCSLSATGNAGVDYRTSAEASAAGKSNGAGIGGTSASPSVGPVTVNGRGTLALAAAGGGVGAAGIGSSYGGSASAISLFSTTLSGIHGGCANAAAEGDEASAKSSLEGGPAIGGGTKGAAAGSVAIYGCTGSDIVGGSKSAGIGGGCWASGARVDIADSTLQVEGGLTGAAIGAGRADTGTAAEVRITRSIVAATGGMFGAGIGLGANGSNRDLGVSHVTIEASDVTATGGAGAAGIGGGVRGYNVNVSIADGSRVEARAGANYLAKYTEKYNGASDTVTEGGGIGQSGAAAVGRGAWGSVTKFQDLEQAAAPVLSVSADSELVALASGDNWALAGFADTSGVEAVVLQARFCRNYDLAGHNVATQDAGEGAGEVCYLDGVAATDLQARIAGTLQAVRSVALPNVGDAFANGYDGAGRVGYYAVAFTLPEAGEYALGTQSTVRTSTEAGDELVGSDDPRYLNSASWRAEDGEGPFGVFTCTAGVNSFDRVAFRDFVDLDPDPAPTPGAPTGPSTPQALTPQGDSDDPAQGEAQAQEPQTSQETPASSASQASGSESPAAAQTPAAKDETPATGSTGSLPKTGDPLSAIPFALAALAALTVLALRKSFR